MPKERAVRGRSGILVLVLGAGVVLAALTPGEGATRVAGLSGRFLITRSGVDGNSEIYVMRADGSGQTNLTNGAASDGGPAWSPDGTRIAFHSLGLGGKSDIFVMNADGSGRTNLTTSGADDTWPGWSPDGTKIAFETDRGAGGYYYNRELFVMNADGSGQTSLTRNAVPDYSPAWSPNGRKIAFASHDEIFVMAANGRGRTNLTKTPAADGHPTWSPDGMRIAFTTYRPYRRCDANLEVYVMNADGSGQKNLRRSPGSDLDPAWSPDGTRIAFENSAGANLEIFVMNADGSGKVNVTNDPANDDRFPNWSPESGKIVFTRAPAQPFPPPEPPLPRFSVPRVTGLKLKTAVKRLRRSVYFVGRVRHVHSTRPRGRVIGQSEPPGRYCHPFDRIDLVVSRG